MTLRPHHGRAAFACALASVVMLIAASVSVAAPSGDVPPPTPVPPNGDPSPFPTSLATPSVRSARPAITASGAILADRDTGQILFSHAADTPRPIASITKVMTALVVRERTDLDDIVRIPEEAVFGPRDFGATSILGLRAGERIRVKDLLYGLLLGSANDAAVALAIHVAGSEAAFVRLMDRRAARLGMTRTRFASVHGLDDRGRSTPRDVLRLVRAALADPVIARISATRFHTIPGPGRDRRIQNRNALLWLYPGAVGVKTGSTAGAGVCVVAAASRGDRRLIAIVLHAEREPFSDAASLLNYGFAGFTRATLVEAGESLGSVRIRGGSVGAVAAASIVALLPIETTDAPSPQFTVDPDVAFPPAPGQEIGTVRYVTGDPPVVIGSVSLRVGSVPLPEAERGSWWARALGAVGSAVRDVVAGFTG